MKDSSKSIVGDGEVWKVELGMRNKKGMRGQGEGET
jgi:hypothetical protein